MIITKFITDLAVTAAKLATDSVTTVKILADAVTDTKIRLSNNAYLRARNAANNADINIAKVNASDRIEFASFPQKSGTPAAADDLVNKSYADSLSGATNAKETRILDAGDITNQYYDLAQVAKTGSINLSVLGGDAILEGASYHYSVSYTGGVGGKTRINFLNDLATGGASALVATDVLQVQYEY